VAVRIDAAQLAALVADARVERINRVNDYEIALAETVPYIGAAAAQAAGKDGTGVRVAVFDSGADYTHFNFGGPGTVAAYQEAVANFPNPYFPSAKFVGGYDFVGSVWPNGDRTEDPNPIDDGIGGSHGTHVADIIAGRSADGTHVGVAPGAQLLPVKVCSSVASSCSGVALLKAVDFALDPDGDGTLDPVDVINLSLGSNYGQKEDDLTEALEQASKLGVVVVAAAGNAANRPYIVSSPSIAPRVISVAQTQVPSAYAYPLVVNAPATLAGIYGNTATVDWAPVNAEVTGDVVFIGRACPGDALPADLTGKIALIDRGVCSVSLKVDAAGAIGAKGVLIGLVAAGDAVSFSFGGGTHFVPTLVIQQSLAAALKAAVGPNATISPANAISLAGSMASTSARGPSISYQTIKPEIGAPGASVSAVYGTGTGQSGFGGTSGATPMISGSAAILIGAMPWLSPDEVKAMLMNNADTEVYENPALLPGKLAPVSRIGAGEVNVFRALKASAAAWVPHDHSAAISFGYVAADHAQLLAKEVRIESFRRHHRTFSVTSAFRTPGKAANAAVSLSVPPFVTLGHECESEFLVVMALDPSKLPNWTLDGGANGGNGVRLDEFEIDGYLTLTDGSESITIPWHVLAKKSASIHAQSAVRAGKKLEISNWGAADGRVDTFSLTGVSDRIPRAQLPKAGDNFAVVDLKAVGVRFVAPGYIQFAISTYGARPTPNYPAEFDVYIDTNGDGNPEFVLYNAENGGFGASGQNLVYVANLATGKAAAYFYTNAEIDSSNVIFTAPLAVLGITADTQINFSVYAIDNYFTGYVTDAIEGMVYTPSKPRFTVDIPVVPPGGYLRVPTTVDATAAAASPSQTGLLLMYRTSNPRNEALAVTVQ
jgi:subtilisin family serine protease